MALTGLFFNLFQPYPSAKNSPLPLHHDPCHGTKFGKGQIFAE